MLTVFSNGVGYPLVYDDYYIRELASGLNEIVFNVSVRDEMYRYITEEAKLRDRDEQTYLIKQIDAGDDRAKVVAQIDLDEWKASMLLNYSNNSKTVAATITEVAPQGWAVVDQSMKAIRRTIPQSDDNKEFNVTPLAVVMECCDVYSVRVKFDNKNKIIYIVDPNLFSNVGAFATRDLNLRKLNYKGKSDNFVTRLYAMGADGLTFASINDGKPYVENFTYSNKLICAYWEDNRYTDAQSLLDDATERLAEMAKPSRSYDCEVLDLAKTNPEIYNFENFALFNVITLIDDVKQERFNYQIVERWDYPYYPAKNKIVLSSVTPNLQSVVTAIVNAINNPTSVFSQKLLSTVMTTTALITGNKGGYLILKDTNGDDFPDELLIMDTADIATATQVWRWNKSGLGYSNTGYQGPYTLGMNMLGQINASMISTGSLDAAIITVGILQDTQGKNYWNLETGEFSLAATTEIGGKSIEDYFDESLTQENVFDALTNNGQVQGIFLSGGQLYINGAYIQAGTISTESLSVGIKSQFEHDYVISDIMGDINNWHNSNHAPVPVSYFVDLSTLKTYVDFDGRTLSTFDNVAYAYFYTDAIGKPSMTLSFKVEFFNTVTVATRQIFGGIQYREGSNTRFQGVYLEAGTYQANQEYTFTQSFTLQYNSDYGAWQPRIAFYFVPQVDYGLYDITCVGSQGDYTDSSMTFTQDGLSSTVRKGDVISSINQSPEAVTISASKINLTGDLSLRGDFHSYKTGDDKTYVFLDSGNLKFYQNLNNVADLRFVIASDYYNGQAGILFGDPQDPNTVTKTLVLTEQVKSGYIWATHNGTAPSPGANTTMVSEGEAHFYGGIVTHSTTDMYGTEFTNLIQNPTQFTKAVKNSSGGTQFTSDRRKKRSIKDLVIEKARSFIMGLKPVKYKFLKEISTSDRYHHGFIAQDVKEAMPEDWGIYCEDKEDDTIYLRYDEFLADMVAVIQDQQKRIETLERRINDLTSIQS